MKKFTLGFLTLLLFANNLASQETKTFRYNLSGEEITIMNITINVPDYQRWHYFSFERGEVIGTSNAVIEGASMATGNIGTEVIDAEWAARIDWDIAFHATDIRTNGGSCLKIADATANTPLSTLFDELKEAPESGYQADELINGRFYFDMSGMPPLSTTQLSACATTNGWATFGMGAPGQVSTGTLPMVVVFKTADGKYAKVHLKQFFGEGTEESPAVGDFEMDYVYQPNGSRNFEQSNAIFTAKAERLSIFPNPTADVLHVDLRDVAGSATVSIYTNGTLVKKESVEAQQLSSMSVSELVPGAYIVKVAVTDRILTNKLFVY